jgi:hypothetical protein
VYKRQVSNSTGTGSPEGRGGGPSMDQRDSIPGRIPFIGGPHRDLRPKYEN